MNIIELAKQAGIEQYEFGFMDITKAELDKFAALVETTARADEREECLKIIDNYEIPVGNSRAGEISCAMTYGALKDIHDAIKARGTT